MQRKLLVTAALLLAACDAQSVGVTRQAIGQLTWAYRGTAAPVSVSRFLRDGSEMFAITSDGEVLQSGDRGVTWNSRAELRRMWELGGSAKELWATGVGVKRSTDGGLTWVDKSGSLDSVGAVWSSGRGDVWIESEGSLYRSTDDGTTWKSIKTPGAITRVWGAGPDDVYATAQSGALYRTGDKGATWTSPATGTTQEIVAMWAASVNEVFAVSEEGVLLYSSDRGATWTTRAKNLQHPMDLWGSSADDLYVTAAFSVVHSVDGGKTFDQLELPAAHNLFVVDGFDRDTVLIGGLYGVVLRGAIGEAAPLSGSFVERKIGGNETPRAWWAGGGVVLGLDGDVLIRSEDHGATWTRVTLPGSYYKLWASGTDDIYAGGFDGGMARSTDGGKTWTALSTGSTEGVNALWGASRGKLYAATETQLLYSGDQGATWTKKATLVINQLVGSAADDMYALSQGNLVHSSDGGATWKVRSELSKVVAEDSKAIWLAKKGELFVGGSGGSLLHTKDGGKTWAQRGTPGGSSVLGHGVYHLWGTTKEIWAVKARQLLRSVDGGITWKRQVVASPESYGAIVGETDANGDISGVYMSGHDGVLLVRVP